jgi:hypothetical protein
MPKNGVDERKMPQKEWKKSLFIHQKSLPFFPKTRDGICVAKLG